MIIFFKQKTTCVCDERKRKHDEDQFETRLVARLSLSGTVLGSNIF